MVPSVLSTSAKTVRGKSLPAWSARQRVPDNRAKTSQCALCQCAFVAGVVLVEGLGEEPVGVGLALLVGDGEPGEGVGDGLAEPVCVWLVVGLGDALRLGVAR